jgi:hypothetical protein
LVRLREDAGTYARCRANALRGAQRYDRSALAADMLSVLESAVAGTVSAQPEAGA